MVMNSVSTSKAIPSVVTNGQGSGLGFGCMGITAFYGDPLPDEEALSLLQSVYDNGCRHFDTAEIYKTGNPFNDSADDKYNESVVGMFLKTVPRDSFTVATKYFPFKYEGKSDYQTVKTALQKSLDRLNLEYVDLYYSHRIASLEGAMEFGHTAKKLMEEGLIKEVGLSECCGSWLKKVHEEACPIGAVQQEWSLMTRNLEDELVPVCRDLNVTIVAYSPLCRMLLAPSATRPPSDWRGTLPRFQEETFQKNSELVSTVMNPIADKYGCTVAQLALAWLFKKAQQLGVVVVPIPGTTKVKNLLANLGSTKVDIADQKDMDAIEELATKVQGLRGDEEYIAVGIESQKPV